MSDTQTLFAVLAAVWAVSAVGSFWLMRSAALRIHNKWTPSAPFRLFDDASDVVFFAVLVVGGPAMLAGGVAAYLLHFSGDNPPPAKGGE